jgi:hypothetical protein
VAALRPYDAIIDPWTHPNNGLRQATYEEGDLRSRHCGLDRTRYRKGQNDITDPVGAREEVSLRCVHTNTSGITTEEVVFRG